MHAERPTDKHPRKCNQNQLNVIGLTFNRII